LTTENQPAIPAKVIHGFAADQIQELRTKKRSELNTREYQALTEALTVRERLERKLKYDVIEVKLKDDLGEFTMKFRKLTPQEHNTIAGIQQKLKTEPDKATEYTNQLYEFLGRASLDGLDEEFWKAGNGFSPDVFVTAVLKVMAESSFPDEKYFNEIAKFR
jgi:hypothetical protein